MSIIAGRHAALQIVGNQQFGDAAEKAEHAEGVHAASVGVIPSLDARNTHRVSAPSRHDSVSSRSVPPCASIFVASNSLIQCLHQAARSAVDPNWRCPKDVLVPGCTRYRPFFTSGMRLSRIWSSSGLSSSSEKLSAKTFVLIALRPGSGW